MPDINKRLEDFRRGKPSIERPEPLRANLESMASQFYSNDCNLSLTKALLHYIFTKEETTIQVSNLKDDDNVYAESIKAMRPHVQKGRFIEASDTFISTATDRSDFIVKGLNDWPLLKLINFALLLSIQSTYRAAVVTSIRNEGVSILEWVAHHRALGFDRIFVYTNNNTDGSNPLLENLARNNVIRLIHNKVDSSVAPQTKAYEHSLQFLPELRQYRWAMFIDADEFFIPRCGQNLDLDDLFSEITDHYGHSVPAAISFNWKWFGSENAFERTNGLLLKRFEHSIHNEHVKTLVQLESVLTMKQVHCPVMFADCQAVDSNLDELKAVTTQTKPVYGLGQINHYWNKSFQEFVIKKLRGRGAVGNDGAQREFSMFFDWGANDRRGNYDPPPPVIVSRTEAGYAELLALPGVSHELARINAIMDESIANMDKELNLKEIYEKRGRAI